jgi:hypothetical protein
VDAVTEDDQPRELVPLRHGAIGWHGKQMPLLREIDFLLRDLAEVDPERRPQQLYAAQKVARVPAPARPVRMALGDCAAGSCPCRTQARSCACFTRLHRRSSGPLGRAGGGPTRIAVQQIS